MEYNDYLEEIEDIIYNLVNNIDIEETKKKISEYKQKNQHQIALNQVKESFKVNSEKINEQKKQDVQMEAPNINEKQEKGQNIKENVKRQPRALISQNHLQNQVLSIEEQESLMKIRAKAGGFQEDSCIKRAYEEALMTLIPKK